MGRKEWNAEVGVAIDEREERALHLLLITFSFPPAGGVGVLRALSFAKYLPGNGIRVDVLTAGNAPAVGRDLSLLKQVPAGVTVHRSWTPDLPFAVRKLVKKIVSREGGNKAGPASPVVGEAQGGGNPLKRLLANLLLPDPQVGWLPFAFRTARRIIRTRGIDAVIVTVPPFSSVRLVTMLRREFPALPLMVDFRDEWLTTTLPLVSFNKNDRAKAIARKAESEAVRDATAVVMVTEAARRELVGRYPAEAPAKFHCIPNGFETRQPGGVAPARSTDRIVLTYLGTVYGSTDPGNLVEAVLALPDALRRRLRLRFIGHIETKALRASLSRLGDIVELKGFVPQAEALAAMDETDYLLLITHDRINVSAKFYDYLSGSKPIVALVDPGGDVRRLVEETRTGCWADGGDAEAIARLLTELLDGTSGCGLLEPDRERIERYHRRPLAAEYARLLHSLMQK